MGISNLVYSMSCTLCSDKTLQESQRIVNNFIWSGKPAKIKHSSLIAGYDEWGLKAPDLATMNKGLRLAWLGRLLNVNIFALSSIYLNKYGGINLLLHSNYDHKMLELPPFYKELFKYYSELRPTDKFGGVLWNNRNILINNKMLFKQEWWEKGIIYIKDLIQDGTLMTKAQLQNKYNLAEIEPLTYIAISCLVRRWKRNANNAEFLADTYSIDLESNLVKCGESVINLKKAKCKDYYEVLIKHSIKESSSFLKFSEMGMTNEQIVKDSYLNARGSTKETEILAWHFKMLHNILPVKHNLVKWGISDVDTCPFCNLKESLIHALWQCSFTQETLKQLKECLNSQEINEETQSQESFLFGTEKTNINNMLLIIKYYIWYLRKEKRRYNKTQFVKEISIRILADKTYMNTHKFNIKWQGFLYLYSE